MIRQRVSFAALIAAIGCAAVVQADTMWLGTNSSDMTDASNYSNGLPSTGNGSLIVNTISPNIAAMTSNIALGWDLLIGTGSNTVGRLDQLSGTMSTGNGNWVIMGFNNGSGPASSTYNLANTAGSGGTFTGFAQGSGSLNNFSKINIGWDANTTSTLNVNTSGTITGGEIEVGSTGGGPVSTFNIDSGTVNLAGNFEVGGNQWSGYGGTSATFRMSGGTITAGNEIWVAGSGTSVSTMTGGTINSNSWFAVGRSGTGTFNMSGGTVNAATNSGAAVLGSFAGATGTLNVSGGTFTAGDGDTAANMLIGEGAIGNVNVIGSTADVNVLGSLHLGLFNDGADSPGVGNLGFVADATGISTISVGSNVNLSSLDGDFLTVDLTAYTGPFVDMLLIDGLTSAGEFTGLPQGAVVPTGNGDYTIDYSSAGDVWLRVAVPEPSTMVLASLGALACFAYRRR